MLFGLSCKVASKCLGKSFSTLQFLTFFILKILFLYNYIPGWSSSSSGAKHWLDLGVVQSNWGATSKVRTLHYISLCIFSWDTKGTFHLPELTGQSIPAIMQGFWYFAGKKAKFRGIFRGKFAEKSANFAGFSREKSQNLRKNQPISREKVKIRGKIGWFRGRKVKVRRKIGRFRGKFQGETSPRNNQ